MKNKKVIIIIVVAVILIGGFAYWWFSKKKPASTTVSGSSTTPNPSTGDVNSSAAAAHDQVVKPVDSYAGIPLTQNVYTEQEIYEAKVAADEAQNGAAAIATYINARKAGDSHATAIAKEKDYVKIDPAI